MLTRLADATGTGKQHVVSSVGVGRRGSALFVAMPRAHSDLHSFLQRVPASSTEPFPAARHRRVLCDVASGLSFLHNGAPAPCRCAVPTDQLVANVVHRDLTLDNVLLCGADDATARAVICDFGVAMPQAKARNTIRGNCRRYAPEALATTGYTPAADVWMLGILCVELSVNGREIFPKMRNGEVIALRARGLRPPVGAAEVSAEFVERALALAGDTLDKTRLAALRSALEHSQPPWCTPVRQTVLACLHSQSTKRPTSQMVAQQLQQ